MALMAEEIKWEEVKVPEREGGSGHTVAVRVER